MRFQGTLWFMHTHTHTHTLSLYLSHTHRQTHTHTHTHTHIISIKFRLLLWVIDLDVNVHQNNGLKDTEASRMIQKSQEKRSRSVWSAQEPLCVHYQQSLKSRLRKFTESVLVIAYLCLSQIWGFSSITRAGFKNTLSHNHTPSHFLIPVWQTWRTQTLVMDSAALR